MWRAKLLVSVAVVLFFVGWDLGVAGDGFLFFLASAIALVLGILARAAEQRATARARLEIAGDDWGLSIGPVLGEAGALITPDRFPPSLARSYRGRSRDWIERVRKRDAELLAQRGYFPTAESFIAGAWRGRDWLAALLIVLLFGLGLLVLAYMLVVRPGGTLTVFYARDFLRDTRTADVSSMADAADDTMACPRCAETIKRAAKMCRFCQLDLTAP